MEIHKTTDNDVTVFSLSGRLDTNTSPQLQDALIPEFDISKKIELDLSNLAYISSAGLRVLLMGEKNARSKGGAFALRNVPEDIMEIFDITGFTSTLTIL